MELKPCPFCGEKDVDTFTDLVVGDEAYRVVGCGNCFAKSRGCLSDDETIGYWNRRASPEPDLTVGPEPAQGDRERAIQFAKGTFGEDAKIEDSPFVDRLAAGFAKVREEATRAERERCVVAAGKAVIDAIRGYRCTHHVDGCNEAGLALVDVLTPDGEPSIDLGEEEVSALIDSVFGDVVTAIRRDGER